MLYESDSFHNQQYMFANIENNITSPTNEELC